MSLAAIAKKLRTVLPADARPFDQSNIDLVDEGRRLQRVARCFPGHVATRQLPQFRVHQWKHLLQCSPISVLPLEQECRHCVQIAHFPQLGPGNTPILRPIVTSPRPPARPGRLLTA